jgi:hypothetical protein
MHTTMNIGRFIEPGRGRLSSLAGIAMRPVSRLSLVVFILTAAALLQAGAAGAVGTASTLYVTTSGHDSGACTERNPCRTIMHAVAVAASGDTIDVGAGTFVEGAGVVIDKNLAVKGAAWISTRVAPGSTDTDVFTIRAGAVVRLENMLVTGGRTGISNEGSLTLKLLPVWRNSEGGIVNSGSLTMSNVHVADNSGAAGITNDGTAEISNSEIDSTHIVGSEDFGLGEGVGVWNLGGTLVMSRVLVAANSQVGVLATEGISGVECPVTTLTNVTVSGNQSGVESDDAGVPDCSTMTLTHVTISANESFGIWASGSVEANNSIVAGNATDPRWTRPVQCFLRADTAVATFRYSLLGDGSCGASTGSGNLVGVDPKLGGLTFFPGCDIGCRLLVLTSTKAHPLLAGSPAIDAAGDAYCTPTDQLGTVRPVGPHCDMGAYEYQPPTGGPPRRDQSR